MQVQTESANGGRKGFFGALFDLSFRHFITGRVVKFLYVVLLVLGILNALFTAGYFSALLGAFTSSALDSSASGIIIGTLFFLVLSPILTLLSVVYVRVLMEIVVVLFRIAENTSEMSHGLRLIADRRDEALR